MSTLGHTFSISEVDVVAIPKAKNVWNQFDEHALLQSFYRLKGETNWELRRRVRDTFVNVANSSYLGLINGITRDLKLASYDALMVNPRMDISGNFLADAPNVVFDGAWVILYTDYNNGYKELEIDRRTPGGNFERLGLLVDKINTTTYFEATLLSANRGTKSMVVWNQQSRKLVTKEAVDPSTSFKLDYKYIVSGTLVFSDSTIFVREVNSLAEVLIKGDYYVDYKEGNVRTFSLPSIGTTARYEYVEYPTVFRASPVILNNLSATNFASQLYQQILQEDGTYVSQLPTPEGVDIINELLSVGGGLYQGK